MTKKHAITFAFLTFVAGCVGGPAVEAFVVRPLSARHATAGVQRWEYQCVRSEGTASRWRDRFPPQANELGAAGWELVTLDGGGACFKRPL